MVKGIILSVTPVYIRIEKASKKLGLDLHNIKREYGINEKTAKMLEDKVITKI